MAEKIRVVHYLNQFFAQLGGEDKAEIGPGFREGSRRTRPRPTAGVSAAW
jgi:hypothetical protein